MLLVLFTNKWHYDLKEDENVYFEHRYIEIRVKLDVGVLYAQILLSLNLVFLT